MKQFLCVAFMVAIIQFIGSGHVYAITTSGSIEYAETWSGTVNLTGDVTITANGSLTIQPGTQIKSADLSDDQSGGISKNRIEIIVESGGSLVAIGTTDNKIMFSPSFSSSPQGSWYGIRILSSNVKLQYCTIELAREGIRIESGTPYLDNLYAHNCSVGAVFTTSGIISNTKVEGPGDADSTPKDNWGRDGIIIESKTQSPQTVKIDNCIISSCSRFGIHSYPGSTELDVSNTTISKSGSSGIVSECNISTFENLQITENGDYGIFGQNKVNINNCTISLNGKRGIELYHKIFMTNSNVTDNGGDGVWVDSQDGIIDHCNISRNNGNGIWYRGGWAGISDFNLKLSNTIISNNGNIGLNINWLNPDGSSGNIINGNKIGIEVNSVMSELDFSNNDIFDNSQFEIRINTKTDVFANGNYWAEPTTSELHRGVTNLTKIYDLSDSTNSGKVWITSWKDLPNYAPNPTSTPTNTYTPRPTSTYTPSPTRTSTTTPTITFTPTLTPTITPTRTPTITSTPTITPTLVPLRLAVNRTFVPTSYQAGQPGSVTLTITIGEGLILESLAVEEVLPPNLTPTNITGGGVWISGSRKIRWFLLSDVTSPLSYTLTPPVDSTIDYEFTGTASYLDTGQEVSIQIGGQALWSRSNCYPNPADINADFEISTSEILAAASSWKRGEERYTTSNILRAASLWKRGGYYQCDSDGNHIPVQPQSIQNDSVLK